MNTRWKPSVTVAAVIHRQNDEGISQYMLVEEETLNGLQLNNPAGHLDPGESPQQGVVREALEETTCEFNPEFLVGIYLSRAPHPARGDTVTYLRLAFSGTASAPNPQLSLDTGIVRTLWMTLDEVRASAHRHRSPMVLKCIEDHAEGMAYPLDIIHTHESAYRI